MKRFIAPALAAAFILGIVMAGATFTASGAAASGLGG